MPTEAEIAENYKKQIEDDAEHSVKEEQRRLHGTSTKENDFNETAVIQSQLGWLGRTKGNVLPYVLQKSLLGHGKGAADRSHIRWLTSKVLFTDTYPTTRRFCSEWLLTDDCYWNPTGEPYADNIDAELQDRDLLFSPPALTRTLPS
ncbi:LOW QUALITY PROTEIN: fatty acid synthase alpha subunit reductase [Colletotrichum tofieldiae]|nr:LOW QUALITY PROTEIN: fatty acid synthase alpha subunit reductase [Colletotrichum tofieldiae]